MTFDDVYGDNYPTISDDDIRLRSYLNPYLEELSFS